MTPPSSVRPPEKISPTSLADYLDIMCKSVFQSGMSWKVIDAKWPGTREALREFDPYAIAEMDGDDVDELTQDTRLIRNRRKIEATIGNARRMIELDEEHKGFQNYLRAHGDFWATLNAVKKDFKFMGDMGTYLFLYVVGEDVIPHESMPSARSSAKAASRR
jgi:3-methyladenine DNA glycosylase Tag